MDKDYFTKRALAFRMLGIGWHIAISLILGALGGYWLDNHCNNDFPIFTLIGLTIGLVVAMSGLYLMMRPLLAHKDDKNSDKEND